MVRTEDVPSVLKHMRFEKPDLNPVIDILKCFPGVKSIVRHEGGTKSGKYKEHPHLHVWYESPSGTITNQTVRNWLNKIPEWAALEFKGQHQWRIKLHDNWTNWATYVVSNPKHTIIVDYQDLSEIAEKVKNDPTRTPLKGSVIEHIDDGQAVQVAQRKSRSMRVQFIDWLEEHREFRRCETITPSNSDEMRSIINDELCDFWEMAFAFNQAIQMVNHAHWVFANPPERARIRSKFQAAILKSNYLV